MRLKIEHLRLKIGCFLVIQLIFSLAQTNLETLFTGDELSVLEGLVHTAQANDANIAKARLELGTVVGETQLTGRLREALTVNTGVSLEGDIYGQASPSYSVSVNLNVMNLIPDAEAAAANNAVLAEALASVRVRTVQAFVTHKVAQERAESAALALESAEAAFRAVSAKQEVGEATLTDQLRAQSTVGDAAMALLEANGNVIVSLESLAATIGETPAAIIAALNKTLAGQ